MKLVVAEPETTALLDYLQAGEPVLVSSDLARTELQRAVRRLMVPNLMERVRDVLASLTTTRITPAICETAGRLDSPSLRSLDALHLAAALDVGDELEELVTYDDRLAEGARAVGIRVVSPA